MAEFEIKDPTEKYTDTVNEVLDLVDNLNDYEGEVTRVRVAVELDTTNGKQLHFLEKQPCLHLCEQLFYWVQYFL